MLPVDPGIGSFWDVSLTSMPLLRGRAINDSGLARQVMSCRLGGVGTGPFAAFDLSGAFGDDNETVQRNRGIFAENAGLSGQFPYILRQIHSDIVHVVEASNQWNSPPGDALITREPGVPIGVLTADCVPIALLDTRTPAVGVVHAGWKGTLAGILQHALENMGEEFRTDPGNVLAWIGPAIGPCCYHVASARRTRFLKSFPPQSGAVPPDTDTLDLASANRWLLESVGVQADHITLCPLCTACHSDVLFSYRAGGGITGGMITAIMLL